MAFAVGRHGPALRNVSLGGERHISRSPQLTSQGGIENMDIRRLNRVRGELECTDHTIAAIASRWGFCDSSHLNRIFKRQFGLSPSDYRAQCWRGVGLARKF